MPRASTVLHDGAPDAKSQLMEDNNIKPSKAESALDSGVDAAAVTADPPAGPEATDSG